METERVADVVQWQVEESTAAGRAITRLANLAAVGEAVLRLATGQGTDADTRRDTNRRMPTRPGGLIGIVTLNGQAPWIPQDRHGRDLSLYLYTDHAELEPYPSADLRTPVDLATLTVTNATSPTGRRRADDTWQLTLTAPSTHLTLDGPWLDLAWAGHLGHWPQPTSIRHQ